MKPNPQAEPHFFYRRAGNVGQPAPSKNQSLPPPPKKKQSNPKGHTSAAVVYTRVRRKKATSPKKKQTNDTAVFYIRAPGMIDITTRETHRSLTMPVPVSGIKPSYSTHIPYHVINHACSAQSAGGRHETNKNKNLSFEKKKTKAQQSHEHLH